MPRSAWFDRKFDSPVGADILPVLRDRLRAAPDRLDAALRGRPAAALTAKPDGKWSAQEHAGHLADLEPLWLARVNDFLAGTAILTPADLTNRKTEEAHHNDRPLVDILAEFRAARTGLLARIEHLDAAVHSRTLVHPRLQTPMRLIDHLYFVAEHDDHHLSKIAEMVG